MTITTTTPSGYTKILVIDEDCEFETIIGILSKDADVRKLAAFGSAMLGDNDE